MKKILIIRFSSIGDIVLTTPVVRCIKTQLPEAEIHYLVKKQFASVLNANPYIAKVHAFDGKFASTLAALQKEQFDFVVDLHHSLRSRRFVFSLRRPSSAFKKLNVRKWLLVKSKINLMPDVHVVQRYFDAVEPLQVKPDDQGADFFISAETKLPATLQNFLLHRPHVVAIAVGSKHETKQLPVDKIRELLKLTTFSAVLLGGKDDVEKAMEVIPEFEDRVISACGELSLDQSALALSKCKAILTGDTGLMHIAAALNVRVFSVWGNTVPAFGMYPYLPKHKAMADVFEVEKLKCRPCSKLGFKRCPQGHFRCMLDQDMMLIGAKITKYLLG